MARITVESGLSLEDLLRSVSEQEQAEAEGALTVHELAAACGHDVKWVRAKLTVLKAEGRVQVVKVRRFRLDDQPYYTPAYRMVDVDKGQSPT